MSFESKNIPKTGHAAQDIAASAAETERLNRDLAHLARDLVAAEDRVAALQADLGAAHAQLAEQTALAEQTEPTRRENGELHALVARVEKERARLQRENTELHALVARVETERARLQAENEDLHPLVARVETERARLQAENEELHALVARVETARQQLAESTIWRLTRPIRAVLNVLRPGR